MAGRAGRGEVEGEVVVQSFTPFHAAVQYARQHDFIGFYEQEIDFREQLKYPPISRLVCITARSRSEAKATFYAQALMRELQKRLPKSLAIVAGPVPAPLAKVQNQYRFQIMLRTSQILQLVELLNPLVTSFRPPEDVNVVVDVDPISLL